MRKNGDSPSTVSDTDLVLISAKNSQMTPQSGIVDGAKTPPYHCQGRHLAAK